MDEKSFALLEKIYDLMGHDKFKILDGEDFGPTLSQGLDDNIHALAAEGYLVVKYAVGGEYCVGLSAAGSGIVESVRSERSRRAAAREEAAKAAQREEQARCAKASPRAIDHSEFIEGSQGQHSSGIKAPKQPRKRPNSKRHPEANLPPRHPELAEGSRGSQPTWGEAPQMQPVLPPPPPRHPFGFWLATYLVATLGALTGGGILVLILWLTHVIG